MQPRYALPARESGRNINLETKPKQVEAWLARLPLSNPSEAAEEMADYLATLNSADLGQDNRARVMDRLVPVVEDIVASLYEHYSAVQPPLPPKHHRSAILAQRLLRGIADGYKILLMDWLKRRFRLFGGDPTALYLQRILLSLQAALEISFETHDAAPEGIWIDLHQTYNYALRNGLKDAIPEGGARLLSIEQIYKSTLLLTLADPYRFPQTELPWAKDVIARFGNLARILPVETSIKGQAGLFVVEVNTDAPAKPLAREQHPMDPRWELVLNTTELAKHLALLLAHLQGRENIEKVGLPDAARDPAYPAMLKRLKMNLGASVQRQSQRRRHESGREFEVCFGLMAVHRLIAPPNPSGTIHYGVPYNEPAPTVIRCQTVNDSMGGMALTKSGGVQGLQIRVGDLVGVRQGNAGWGVGLVRWFRSPAQNEISFGVQLLAPKALAVQLRRIDNGRQWPGLLLHPSPVTKQSPMLLAQPGAFLPSTPAEIRTPKGKQPVRIGTRTESTPSVEVFQFQLETAAPE